MAHFLRGKQAGVQRDLSAGLGPEHFVLDDFARYGINSQITALAYDPVQSLLAAGTSDSQFGNGQIYVFGQKRVCVTLKLPRRATVKTLQFCVDKLLSVDSKNDICIFELDTGRMIGSYAPPGHITALLSDPSLDYALIGLQHGDIMAWDMDRQHITPFKIPNFWRERNSKSRAMHVVSMAFHPRDIGTLLIGYTEGAVLYSFKQNKPIKFFQYELHPGAPGGGSDVQAALGTRRPALTHAIWHPTGTFILTTHDDSSLVFWDPKDGRIIQARTLQDINVDKPGSGSGAGPGTFSLKEPIYRIAWCSKENPDDTGVLIAGGAPTSLPTKGLTFFELGPTPVYATSPWQVLTNHFETPRRQRILPTPPHAEVVDFCLIPRSSPHYAGSHDPIAVISLLSSGELVTLSFPSGYPISPHNQLHLSLSYVHPFITNTSLACIDRTRWLGLRENRQHGPKFLLGGAEGQKALKRFEKRNVIQTAHADGTICIWDAGHDDEVENEDAIQVDLARAVGRMEDIDVTKMSLSGAAGEISIGLRSGELVIFRYNNNRNVGRDIPPGENDGPGRITNIMDRTDPGLKQGFLPQILLDEHQGPVTALMTSDVGFTCVGYQEGTLVVIDMRGPAIIYNAHLRDFIRQKERGSIRRRSSVGQAKPEWPTCIEFGVMTLEGEDYSSILCFVGTNLGRFATFKILPSSDGRYSVSFAGFSALEARIISISPMDAELGSPAYASQTAVSGLRSGYKINGVVVVTTVSGAWIFKPATAKGAHKAWDQSFCDSARVVHVEAHGYSLVGLFGDGYAKSYSIPGLKEIGAIKVSDILDIRRLPEAIVSPTGDVFGWTSPSEMAILNVWGTGLKLSHSTDKLFNVQALIPPRPTISNVQWISGVQHVSPSDMDVLIGGPNRPPSKRMIEQLRAEESQRREAGRRGSPARTGSPGQLAASDETYWAYMQRQVQERTERLGIAGDNMDRLEESSAGWADDVSKFVSQQKKKAVMGTITSKFGF